MKKTVSVYHYNCFPFSETFIYRQLLGLGSYFNVQLLTRKIQNVKDFPGLDPVLLPPGDFFRKLLRSEERFFQRFLGNSRLFHVNFGHIAIYMQGCARRAGIPMTVHFHGVDASASLKDHAYVKALAKSNFEAVIVCSDDMKNRLTPYLPEGMKCFVSYYGIPLAAFPFKHRRSVPDGAVFLQLCRLSDKKGLDLTLKAFKRYLDQVDSKATLVIAGDGPLANDLRALAASLGIEHNVHFPGVIKPGEVVDMLHSADVFLHPSVTGLDGDMEGIPNVIAEAMATGLPVVSSQHSGIPELVHSGENGFLAKAGDFNDLFEQMKSLKKADVGQISLSARETVEERFDYRKNINQLSDYLRNVMV